MQLIAISGENAIDFSDSQWSMMELSYNLGAAAVTASDVLWTGYAMAKISALAEERVGQTAERAKKKMDRAIAWSKAKSVADIAQLLRVGDITNKLEEDGEGDDDDGGGGDAGGDIEIDFSTQMISTMSITFGTVIDPDVDGAAVADAAATAAPAAAAAGEPEAAAVAGGWFKEPYDCRGQWGRRGTTSLHTRPTAWSRARRPVSRPCFAF